MARLGLLLAAVLLVAACGAGEIAHGPSSSRTPAPIPTLTCEKAPAYLVAALQSRIHTEGVTLDRAYIGSATDLMNYISERGGSWWWVVGHLAGVDDPVAIWLISNRNEGGTHIYLAANAVAERHSGSDWDLDPSSIDGSGTDIRDCLR